ncbi:hypothetical protein nvc2_005 [Namao virus]|nr:hypothetical protein nvc2_005 [Namao virus]
MGSNILKIVFFNVFKYLTVREICIFLKAVEINSCRQYLFANTFYKKKITSSDISLFLSEAQINKILPNYLILFNPSISDLSILLSLIKGYIPSKLVLCLKYVIYNNYHFKIINLVKKIKRWFDKKHKTLIVCINSIVHLNHQCSYQRHIYLPLVKIDIEDILYDEHNYVKLKDRIVEYDLYSCKCLKKYFLKEYPLFKKHFSKKFNTGYKHNKNDYLKNKSLFLDPTKTISYYQKHNYVKFMIIRPNLHILNNVFWQKKVIYINYNKTSSEQIVDLGNSSQHNLFLDASILDMIDILQSPCKINRFLFFFSTKADEANALTLCDHYIKKYPYNTVKIYIIHNQCYQDNTLCYYPVLHLFFKNITVLELENFLTTYNDVAMFITFIKDVKFLKKLYLGLFPFEYHHMIKDFYESLNSLIYLKHFSSLNIPLSLPIKKSVASVWSRLEVLSQDIYPITLCDTKNCCKYRFYDDFHHSSDVVFFKYVKNISRLAIKCISSTENISVNTIALYISSKFYRANPNVIFLSLIELYLYINKGESPQILTKIDQRCPNLSSVFLIDSYFKNISVDEQLILTFSDSTQVKNKIKIITIFNLDKLNFRKQFFDFFSSLEQLVFYIDPTDVRFWFDPDKNVNVDTEHCHLIEKRKYQYPYHVFRQGCIYAEYGINIDCKSSSIEETDDDL